MASDEKRPRAFSTLDGRQLPPIYDEVYDIICPNNENRISGEVFVLAMANTGVSRVQLREIWDIVHHTKTGSLDRDQFNRALAYVAMCQNGETPTADKMDLWIEPPTPKLNDLATIVALEGNASKVLMDYTYRELEEDDFVQVTVEEKKGGNLLKKHTNYSIYSKRCNKTVVRRYSEFENIESLLKKRYPYRVIIALPKKGHGLGTPSPEFIEARRVALEMFLRCLLSHPILRDDDLVKLFVSAENFKSELNACIKAGIKTELEMSPVTHIMLSLLPQDTLHKIEEIRPEIRMLLEGFTRLTTIAENSIHRAKEESADWLTYSQCVHQIASLQNSRIAGDDHWPEVKKGLKGIGQQIESIAEKSTEQITREESACTRLRTWCALLASCSELIERKMKSLEKDLARIKAKISKTRNRLSSHNRLSSPSSQSTLDKLDAKLEQRASTQELLEKENEFCIYCIWMEMKLLKTNFAQVGTMFEELSSCHSIGKRSLSTAWETLGPIAAALVEELDVTSPFQNKIADSNDFPLSPTRIEE